MNNPSWRTLFVSCRSFVKDEGGKILSSEIKMVIGVRWFGLGLSYLENLAPFEIYGFRFTSLYRIVKRGRKFTKLLYKVTTDLSLELWL